MRWYWIAAAVVVAGTSIVVTNLPETPSASANSSSPALATIHSPLSRPLVKGISFDGGRGMPLAELRDAVHTEIGDAVDKAQLATDRRAIERELASRGYLAATVADATITYANGGAYVVFDIVRGPLFHLRDVSISGPGQQDADVVTLAAGDPALDIRLGQARESLAHAIARRANRDTNLDDVELQVHTDREAAAVDVAIVTR